MAVIGFHASHEQYAPGRLLKLIKAAEGAGFQAGMCSDHFRPWSERQGHSGFAWSWLGAALEATSLSMGLVTVPGYRYHPAILAQAGATLAEMFPGRFWMALGTGEALNETVTGAPWPSKKERAARLEEAVRIIRELWAGRTVDHEGYVRIRNARLYVRPQKAPLLLGAALTRETAGWVAGWADGLITAGVDPSQPVEAFRRGGGEGKPIFLQASISFADSEEQALMEAYDQWRHAALETSDLADIASPQEFDAAVEDVPPEKMKDLLRISSSIEQHVEWIRGYLDLGFDAIYLHNVGKDPEKFVSAFGRQVLPVLT